MAYLFILCTVGHLTGCQGVGGSNPLVSTKYLSSISKIERALFYLMIPAIIIPAFNPPDTFYNLIQSIRNETSIPIIIVDDGSQPAVTIDPAFICVKLLRNKLNQGKGFSLLKGIHYAFEAGYTHSITLDADSQHDPAFILEFLAIDDNISIVCGKRDLTGSMPFHRRISNIITSKIVSFICQTKLFDSQCGYRRYNLQDVCRERYFEKGFQFETEILIKLLKNKLLLYHVDIPTIYAGENSSMRHINDTIKFIRMIFRTLGHL